MTNHVDWRTGAAQEYRARCAALSSRRDGLLASIAHVQKEIASIDAELRDIGQALRVVGVELEPSDLPSAGIGRADEPLPQSESTPIPQFKDVALEVIRERYPQAIKSTELQAAVENRLGRKFHPKTSGMTLYRARQDGFVRREGRKWYYVPLEESAGAEKPEDREMAK
jgi:hypothetical protein